MFLSKSHGRIMFSGQVQPNGKMQIQASGNDFFIEEFNYFESKNINLAGLLNFDAQISQSLLKPLIDIRGTLTKTSAGDIPAQDTQFQILWNKNVLSGFCEVFGKNLIAEWSWPFSKKGVFKIKAHLII